MKMLHIAAYTLLWAGGINWGLAGIFNGFNLVETILGFWPQLVQIVYILVGASTVYIILTHMNDCKVCSGK